MVTRRHPAVLFLGACVSISGGAHAQSHDVPVRFETEETGLYVLARPLPSDWQRAGVPPTKFGFADVCVAPCETRLDASPRQFALRRADGPLLPAAFAYELEGPARFHVRTDSRADVRRRGWYVLGIVGGVGLVSATTGFAISCGENRECAKWTSLALWGGLGVLAVGTLVGLPMVLRHDDAVITVLPGVPSAPTSSAADQAARPSLELAGLTISGAL